MKERGKKKIINKEGKKEIERKRKKGIDISRKERKILVISSLLDSPLHATSRWIWTREMNGDKRLIWQGCPFSSLRSSLSCAVRANLVLGQRHYLVLPFRSVTTTTPTTFPCLSRFTVSKEILTYETASLVKITSNNSVGLWLRPCKRCLLAGPSVGHMGHAKYSASIFPSRYLARKELSQNF